MPCLDIRIRSLQFPISFQTILFTRERSVLQFASDCKIELANVCVVGTTEGRVSNHPTISIQRRDSTGVYAPRACLITVGAAFMVMASMISTD